MGENLNMDQSTIMSIEGFFIFFGSIALFVWLMHLLLRWITGGKNENGI